MEDMAAAAAVTVAATQTGTKTVTLDTAAAPTTVTTTHPANMHRMGRTIHPPASVWWFSGQPSFPCYLLSLRLCAQTECDDCACYACFLQVRRAVTYLL